MTFIKWGRVNQISIGDKSKPCYGVSVKFWPTNNPIFWPVVYTQDGQDKRHKQITHRRVVMGWWKFTAVIYLPCGK